MPTPTASTELPTTSATDTVLDGRRYVLGYVPAMDGMRGVISLGVLIMHAKYAWLPGAVVYMNMFFLVSGYLITSLLLRDIRVHGRVRIAKFYIDRVLRIFPANYVMITVFLIAALLLLDDIPSHLKEAGAAAAYVSNWTRAFAIPTSTWLGHTWSLSVEEQYYLCWPLLLSLLSRHLGLGVKLIAAIGALIVAAIVWRITLNAGGASADRLYNATDCRIDTLLFGCVLALAMHREGFRAHPWVRTVTRRAAFPMALTLFLGCAWTIDYRDHALYVWQSPLIDMCTLVLIAGLNLHRDTWAHKLFEFKPLVYVGKRSYSIYIWHFPIFMFLLGKYGLGAPWLITLGVALSLAIAMVSYRFVELPFMVMRSRFH